MIHIKCENIKTSPPPQKISQTQLQPQTSIISVNSDLTGRSPVSSIHGSDRRKPSAVPSETKLMTTVAGQQIPHHHHHHQLIKPTQVTQEIITNQLKIKTFFGGFNHRGFDSRSGLVDQIVSEFNVELDNLIRLSYLTLTLKEIHESRKWINILQLKGCFIYLFILFHTNLF